MRSHYSLRVLIFHFLERRLKLRNIFVLLSYFTVKLVILAKKAVIKNFSKVKYSVLEENLSKKELESLKNLSRNHDIIVQKPDKGDSAVIVDKKVDPEKMNEMLDKNKQFLELSI